MEFKYINRWILLSLLIFLSGNASAAKPPSKSWTFSFRLENDLFANTDRFYTNGIKFSWISPELEFFEDLPWMQKPGKLQEGIKTFMALLPYSDDESRQRNIALSIGQKMFTPKDIARRDLIIDDRPYGGWLYGSMAFHSKLLREDDIHKQVGRLDTFEIQVGFTGDWSLAEQAQDLVHSIRGIKKANGWDNQIDTELGVALIYDRKYRVVPDLGFHGQWGADAIVNAGVAVGNVFSHFNAGIEVRFGWNLPADFGTSLIRPAGDTEAPADTDDPRYDKSGHGFSFHIFGASSGRIVLHDIFLDGNTFSDSHSIDKETFVGDFVLGASVIYNRFKLSYSQVLRTKEFEGQPSGHNFGSVSLSFTY